MSIATAITALQGRVEDAYTALQAKGATIPATKNTYNLPTTIGTITSGGSAEKKDVNFIDYDGTILHSYTAQEAQALTDLPTLPTRTGLTCQGWNYTLAQMKSCVSDVGTCCVGAMYTTRDGRTRLKITIHDEAYSEVYLVISQTNANGVRVNWGDGSSESSSPVTVGNILFHHTYTPSSYPATYTIKLDVVSGTMTFPAQIFGLSGTESASNPISAWCGILEEVNIGNGVTSIWDYAFRYCGSLKSISIPSTVTSFGMSSFDGCRSMSSITIPSAGSVRNNTSGLFIDCSSLSSISIPSSISAMPVSCFKNCYSLSSITTPYNIQSGTFQNCCSLSSIITSSTTGIGALTFGGCSSISSITSLGSVTTISTLAFQNCFGLRTLDFSQNQNVPTLENVNAFSGTSDDMKIIVPNALYETWKAATNWSTYASRIVMANPSITFRATQANSTICLNKVGNPDAISLEYLDANRTWTPYTIGTTLTLTNVGDTVYFRCPSSTTQNFGLDASNYHQFTMTGGISAEGHLTFLNNVNGLLSMGLDSSNAYCYYKLFSGCAALDNAPKLPTGANSNATSAFAYMFEGCTGLTDLPSNFGDLPVNVRSENLYKGMFKGCTSLETVNLPFTTLVEDSTYSSMGCFDEMFMGCSSLDTIVLTYRGNFSTDYFNDWVKNVSATGTIYYGGSDTTVGDYAIPTGWTIGGVNYQNYINTNIAEMNTGHVPTTNTRVVGRFRGNVYGNYYVGTSDTKWRFFNAGSGADFYFDINGMSNRINVSGQFDITKWYDMDVGNFYFECVPVDGGTTVSKSSTTRSFTQTNPLMLGSSTYHSGSNYEQFDCAGFKIYEGTTLVKDYRPALDTNNVACFYEEVSGTYCYPSSGTFLAY